MAITRRARIFPSKTNQIAELALIITDSGSGISEELLANLNSEASSLAVTTKEHGHGLGIRAAKSELSRVGGSLNIKSKVGFGTIVSIRLPTQIIAQ